MGNVDTGYKKLPRQLRSFFAFIDNVDTESTAIANLKAVHFSSADIIQQQLMEVNLKFYSFVMAFEALESRSCTAQKAKLVLDELQKECDTDINEKFASVVEKNEGFNVLIEGAFEGLTLKERFLIKNTPVASCEVERTFSQYKISIRSNRLSMTGENIICL